MFCPIASGQEPHLLDTDVPESMVEVLRDEFVHEPACDLVREMKKRLVRYKNTKGIKLTDLYMTYWLKTLSGTVKKGYGRFNTKAYNVQKIRFTARMKFTFTYKDKEYVYEWDGWKGGGTRGKNKDLRFHNEPSSYKIYEELLKFANDNNQQES